MVNVREKTETPLAERVVVAILLPMALWNLMAHISLIAGFSFRALSMAYSVLLLGVLAIYIRKAWARRACSTFRDDEERAQFCVLVGMSLIGGALAFVSVRPVWDDSIYIGGRAVYFMEFDSVPLDLNFHDHGLLDFPIHYPLEFAQTIHLLWGYVAYILGVPCLDIFHFFVPVLGGIFIPLAHYLALSKFCDDRRLVIVGVAGILAFLCIDGGTPGYLRTYGNWAFVGIWLGKSILISILVPIFIAFSMDWFSYGSRYNWYKLFMLGMVGSGLSGSAMVMLPLLSVALAGGHVCSRGIYRGILRTLAGYFSSLAYLIAVALFLRITIVTSSMHHLGFEYAFPDSFWGQWKLIFGGPLSLTNIAFCVSIGLTFILGARPQRRFFAAWIAILALVALNPFMMPIVAKYLTTLSAYWRLFFLLPFPLTLGIATTRLWGIRRIESSGATLLACAVLLGFALVFNLVDYQRNEMHKAAVFSRISFGLFAHKIPKHLEVEVRRIIEASVPGTMIAPQRYSAWIPLYTNSIPQVSVRDFMLMHASIEHGRMAEGNRKKAAIEYISGQREHGLQFLEELLVKQDLKNVVLDAKMRESWDLISSLRRHGFRKTLESESYILFCRR